MTSSVAEEARSLLERAAMRVLDERTLVEASGDDTQKWLNGQVSNDVSGMSPGESIYALVLNLQGKILADVWIVARSTTSFLLSVPSENREAIMAYLDRFIIMEDVRLAAIDHPLFAVAGPEARHYSAHPDFAAWDLLGAGGGVLIGSRPDLPTVSFAAWELARLRGGRPRYGADFGDFVLPQEAGLKERAVSFTKGCYQGQEAVVMLEHRGKPRQKLVLLEIESNAPPLPIETPILDSGAPVGQLRSSAFDPDLGKTRAFGYVKRSVAEAGRTFHVDGHMSRVTEVLGG